MFGGRKLLAVSLWPKRQGYSPVPGLLTKNSKMPNMLDKLPDSDWFFCFPLSYAVICIILLGVIHPLLWFKVMRVYRSEIFVFMYVLIVFWAVLSVALFYAVLAASHCLYSFWIWYTIVFSLSMAALMFLLFSGFCVLGMRRKSIVALLGVMYYLVTLYFTSVVNKQRKAEFGLNAHCGSCALRLLPTSNKTAEFLVPLTYKANHTLWNTQRPQETPHTLHTKTKELTTTTLGMMIPSIAALLAREDNKTEQTPITIKDPERPTRTLLGTEREAAIAMLSELLLNSDECRKPRKPAHGRFQVSARQGKTSLKLTLYCDEGYRESSVGTRCKSNWWDYPIPQCRKRKPPDPPNPGGCIMPGYPSHGEYRVAGHPRARPGERVTGENVVLEVKCDEPYRALDPYVICVEGKWRQAPPNCLKHCQLTFQPNVDYKCLKTFKDEFTTCTGWQPTGGVVVASCKPGYAHRGPFRYMKCRGQAWDHVVSCQPNANFTSLTV